VVTGQRLSNQQCPSSDRAAQNARIGTGYEWKHNGISGTSRQQGNAGQWDIKERRCMREEGKREVGHNQRVWKSLYTNQQEFKVRFLACQLPNPASYFEN